MKRHLTNIFIMCILAFSLAGCGKTGDVNENISDENIEETTESTESILESNAESSENAGNANALTMYQAFLDGNEPVYLDMYYEHNLSEYPDLDTEYFKTNTPYYKDGFAQNMAYNMGYEYTDDFHMNELQYAYIDCGNDGNKELALWFKDVETGYDLTQCIIVIKEIDDKLQVCYAKLYGYRAFSYINPYGLVFNSGSGGAALWYTGLEMIDADGVRRFVYGQDDYMNVCGMYLPWMEDLVERAESAGLADSLYVVEYAFEEYQEGTPYEEYLKNNKYTYYEYENYDYDDSKMIELSNADAIYDEGSAYYEFMKSMDLDFYEPDEVKNMLKEHIDELIPDQEMQTEEEVEWSFAWNPAIDKGDAGIDGGGENGSVGTSEGEENFEGADAKEYIVTNPSWEYTSLVDFNPSSTSPRLVKVSETSNEIIDEDVWLDNLGVTYDFFVPHDDRFSYELWGGETYYPFMISIYENDELVAILNMEEFRNPPEVKIGDEWLVGESVRYVKYYDDLLYVEMSHRTYAESAPQNAYIMALDPDNDYEVVWKSAPLVANANNFEIIGDTIICGYGFTNEPDFIYLLDRHSGVQTDVYPVKTGPDYFYIIDGKLYVRTYNTDYVYDIVY